MSPSAPPTESWPLPHYDAGNTRTAPRETGPSSGPVDHAWDQSVAGSAVGLPVADADGVYVSVAGESEAPRTTIVRLDPASGDHIWTVARDRPIESGPALDGSEIFVSLGSSAVGAFATSDGTDRTVSVPAARNDREFLATGGLLYVTDDQDDLHAVDAASGDRSFTFDADTIAVDAPVAGDIQEWSVQGFAVDGDRVYVAAAAHYNDELPPDLGRVYALDPAAGTIVWTRRLAPDTPTDPTPARAVAVREGTVYVASEQGLWAFDAADGTRVWASGDLADDLWARHMTVTSEQVIVTAAGTALGLDAATGETRWTTEVPHPRESQRPARQCFSRVGPARPPQQPCSPSISRGPNSGGSRLMPHWNHSRWRMADCTPTRLTDVFSRSRDKSVHDGML